MNFFRQAINVIVDIYDIFQTKLQNLFEISGVQMEDEEVHSNGKNLK